MYILFSMWTQIWIQCIIVSWTLRFRDQGKILNIHGWRNLWVNRKYLLYRVIFKSASAKPSRHSPSPSFSFCLLDSCSLLQFCSFWLWSCFWQILLQYACEDHKTVSTPVFNQKRLVPSCRPGIASGWKVEELPGKAHKHLSDPGCRHQHLALQSQ